MWKKLTTEVRPIDVSKVIELFSCSISVPKSVDELLPQSISLIEIESSVDFSRASLVTTDVFPTHSDISSYPSVFRPTIHEFSSACKAINTTNYPSIFPAKSSRTRCFFC